VSEATEDMRPTRADKLHLVMIFAPIGLILLLLLTPKEAVGCGPLAGLWGVTQIISENGCRAESLPWLLELIQNSAGDAGSAGWWAMALLVALFFLDPEIRQSPGKIVSALAEAGLLVSRLYLMFLAVSVIDFCLNLTGLSNYIAVDIISWLRALGGIIGESALFLFLALLATMLMAILLDMGMPTVRRGDAYRCACPGDAARRGGALPAGQRAGLPRGAPHRWVGVAAAAGPRGAGADEGTLAELRRDGRRRGAGGLALVRARGAAPGVTGQGARQELFSAARAFPLAASVGYLYLTPHSMTRA